MAICGKNIVNVPADGFNEIFHAPELNDLFDSMDLQLKDKIALVTGASRGIGAATARLLASEGADVVLTCHSDKSAAQKVADEVRDYGRKAWVLQFDISDPAEIHRITVTLSTMISRLDILILCAGKNIITPFDELTNEDWRNILDINLNGPFLLLQTLVTMMPLGSSVVTVASVAAHTGAPHHAHYAAAKAGLINLTKSAARALAPGIRVNCVAPGITHTEMGNEAITSLNKDYVDQKLLAGRFATPDEIAKSIVFMASPAAGFIYGATLDVNGGRELR